MSENFRSKDPSALIKQVNDQIKFFIYKDSIISLP